ncbi:hypothetical protein [Colwellia psychrerythraea]|uniref:SMODS and SLOG-associating 2TM effector domain-containing protein n=1 Tax=Colwellia psychrerythraea (strain 34H / ATCC BAA-681) TaxID=167879 RepID=Q488K1_COLP3|nr:hypothetical protein [Colwellia psychrerythraea]AAZ25668.1 hypothetical protein CPS_0764 [Colwellia psychrerythraea 34H]
MRTDCTGNIPFILGVTGHRDLFTSTENSPEVLKGQIRQALSFWQKKIGANTPLWLLTGLAEGADLLVAETVLALQSEGENILLLACLPMPESAFRKDFVNSDALSTYTNILERITKSDNKLFELKNPLSSREFEIAINDNEFGALRNALYLNQSLFVAKYCNALLALWDGHQSKGAGGSADAVQYKLGNTPSWPDNIIVDKNLLPASDFDGQVSGVVHHILVPRKTDSSKLTELTEFTSIEVGIGKLYSSVGQTKGKNILNDLIVHEFQLMLDEMTFYNQIAQNHPVKSNIQSDGLSSTNAIFEKSDAIAIANQSKYRNIVKAFFSIITPGFIAYELAGNYINELSGVYILIVVLLAMLGSGLLIKYVRKNNPKWQYQLARGVAETIRIREFLNLADVAPTAEPLIPRRYRENLPLLNHVIQLTEIQWWDKNYQSSPESIKSIWLDEQVKFLDSRLVLSANSVSELLYKRPRYAAHLCSKIASFSFYTAVVFGLILLMNLSLFYVVGFDFFSSFNGALMYIVQYGLMLAGIVVLWSEIAGYESTTLGYSSLKTLYERATTLFEETPDKSSKKMLLELAKEAVFEHVTWTRSEMASDLKER